MTLPACPRWFEGLPDPRPPPEPVDLSPAVPSPPTVELGATSVALPGGDEFPPGPPPAGAAATVQVNVEENLSRREQRELVRRLEQRTRERRRR